MIFFDSFPVFREIRKKPVFIRRRKAPREHIRSCAGLFTYHTIFHIFYFPMCRAGASVLLSHCCQSSFFIWFADFLIIALILCKKLILLYFNAQLYTRKIYRFNARKTKKNSRYIYSNCSSTSEVHAALTLLFPAHLYSDRSISLELLSVFLSDSLNYLPEKTTIMSRPKLYIFFKCDQRRQVFLRHNSSQ